MSFFFTLLIFAGVTLLTELLFQPKVENAKPSGLGDFKFPTAQQDRPIPLVWGTVRVDGPNVVWYGDLRKRAISEKVKTGLFSSQRQVVGFQYDVGLQFALCRGNDSSPVELRRVLVAKQEVFSGSIPGEGSTAIDEPELFASEELGGEGGISGTLSWRPGTTTQTVNSYIAGTGEQAVSGVTPRFTGTAYATWEQGYIGNSPRIQPWAFDVRRLPNGLGLGTPGVNSGLDANPANVLYEILTDPEWGLGFPAGDVDTASFTAAASTLLSEGNGFSFLLDRDVPIQELIDTVQEQIDGQVFLDHRSGKWKLTLARYVDPSTAPLLTSPIRVESYSPGGWEGTVNVVQVQFNDRAQDYRGQIAPAQDPANAQIQGGGTVTTIRPVTALRNYPGVKVAALANDLAWRDLQTASIPLVNATVAVDRTFWDVEPGGVIAWTDAERQLSVRGFRIKRIDYGNLDREEIVMDLVEDVFQYMSGSFGAPAPSSWTNPATNSTAFPSDEQIAFEAPRGLVFRGLGFVTSTLWASGRRTTSAASFKLMQRNASGAPSGSFSEIAEGYEFLLIGELSAALDASQGNAIPLSTLLVVPTPDSQAALEAIFDDSVDTVDVGTNLVNLIRVNDEFMLVMSATTSGGNVQLVNVYRGVLDGGTQDHASGDKVYVMHAGGALGSTAIPETNQCEVKLLPRTPTNLLAEASATTITITNPGGNGLDRRARRPYCPGSVSLESTLLKSSASLEGVGSNAEDFGIDVDFTRRDYRTAEGGDEIAALTTDAATLFADFPTANNTTTEIEVVDDPDGTPTSLFTDTGISGTSHAPLRIEILAQTDGALPTKLRLLLSARHDDASASLLSRHSLQHDFNVTSALTGDFNFGARAQAVTSNLYTADAAGTHSFVLSSALPGGEDVEYRLNGGSWTQLIAGGGTSGSILGVVISDTIELRHQGTASPLRKQVDMTAPGAGTDGYFVLTG